MIFKISSWNSVLESQKPEVMGLQKCEHYSRQGRLTLSHATDLVWENVLDDAEKRWVSCIENHGISINTFEFLGYIYVPWISVKIVYTFIF